MNKEHNMSVRVTDEQYKILMHICEATGWTPSQVFRYLLENAKVRPASIVAEIESKLVSKEEMRKRFSEVPA